MYLNETSARLLTIKSWLLENHRFLTITKPSQLTTSMMTTGLGKLGFSLAFLMASVHLTYPPHSSSTRGELTGSSWYLFISRTPQQRTCVICNWQRTRRRLGLQVWYVCVCVCVCVCVRAQGFPRALQSQYIHTWAASRFKVCVCMHVRKKQVTYSAGLCL